MADSKLLCVGLSHTFPSIDYALILLYSWGQFQDSELI